jgi:hypothetical protein
MDSLIERKLHWITAVMLVLVCASRKGGGGKTVCARHLAVAALHNGYRVAIVGSVAKIDVEGIRSAQANKSRQITRRFGTNLQ